MDWEARLRRANGTAGEIASALFDKSEEILLALLDNPRLTEEHVKVLLSRKDLSRNVLQELAARDRLVRPYAVKLALVRHRHSPRQVAMTLLRHLYTFDLLGVSSQPSVPAEIRRQAEEALAQRAPALALGERISMARRAHARLAAVFVSDADPAVWRVALDNPRLTEDGVLRALGDPRTTPAAVHAIAQHPRWSLRYEVRLGIVRSPAASFARVLALVDKIAPRDLSLLAADRALPRDRRLYLARLGQRAARRATTETGGTGSSANRDNGN